MLLLLDFGYVEFEQVEQAAQALLVKSHELKGFRLKVQQVKRTQEVLVGVSKNNNLQQTGIDRKTNPQTLPRHMSYSSKYGPSMKVLPARIVHSSAHSISNRKEGVVYTEKVQISHESVLTYSIFYQHLKRLDVRGTATAISNNWTNYGLQKESKHDYFNRIDRIGFFSNRISVSKWKV